MENTTKQRRSSIKIMGKMIGLVKPLAHIMTAAVLLGTLGYLTMVPNFRTVLNNFIAFKTVTLSSDIISVDEISDQFRGSCSDAWNPPLCRTVL